MERGIAMSRDLPINVQRQALRRPPSRDRSSALRSARDVPCKLSQSWMGWLKLQTVFEHHFVQPTANLSRGSWSKVVNITMLNINPRPFSFLSLV
jgi:hypothetical protein